MMLTDVLRGAALGVGTAIALEGISYAVPARAYLPQWFVLVAPVFFLGTAISLRVCEQRSSSVAFVVGIWSIVFPVFFIGIATPGSRSGGVDAGLTVTLVVLSLLHLVFQLRMHGRASKRRAERERVDASGADGDAARITSLRRQRREDITGLILALLIFGIGVLPLFRTAFRRTATAEEIIGVAAYVCAYIALLIYAVLRLRQLNIDLMERETGARPDSPDAEDEDDVS